jgi:hypothetical protein
MRCDLGPLRHGSGLFGLGRSNPKMSGRHSYHITPTITGLSSAMSPCKGTSEVCTVGTWEKNEALPAGVII